MKNFQKNYQVKLTNPPPPPPYENLNPYQQIQDPHLLICLAGTHRWLNIDSMYWVESMLSQGYVPAWWSPVYTQKVITARILRFIEALQHTSGTNQEKGHSASQLSHVQPKQAGLDKQFLESKILSTCLNIRWCSK